MLVNLIKKGIRNFLKRLYGDKIDNLFIFMNNPEEYNLLYNRNICGNSTISSKARIYPKYTLLDSQVGDFTYIAQNATIRLTSIGKFCSIGANFVCGWGIHPTNGISTSPMFYSTQKQNGTTLSNTDKIKETLPIHIGNDVFIGMNVTVLDGVTIGDGAVIGAGSVVSKDIPPYAVAVGSPIRIIKYRFEEDVIHKLLNIAWWNWNEDRLDIIEKSFFDVDNFVQKYIKDIEDRNE
ncbi:CatB-related O-acetyltransferase [Dysgonomonas sp. HDW5A]|uniref:CatB-related O-acetyltransferase n=1 Tax=Dysgonomonas sp. HDW5A TaxID=2714926 RepID=UPI001C8820DE|nr:CatB-related O-acetyltransferase [Dysgonomonas sp. HDW5A]